MHFIQNTQYRPTVAKIVEKVFFLFGAQNACIIVVANEIGIAYDVTSQWNVDARRTFREDCAAYYNHLYLP